MGRTKKVGMAGRFGPHYGSRVRNVWRDVMVKLKVTPQKCPRCHSKIANMREFIGVYHCPRCDATWTGGAFETETERGREALRGAVRFAREALETESKTPPPTNK